LQAASSARAQVGQKGRALHKVLGLIAAQEHFGQGDHIGPRIPPLRPKRARFGGIAGDVANSGVTGWPMFHVKH
jgi:hypothetical protein